MSEPDRTNENSKPMQRRKRRVLRKRYHREVETQEAAREVPIPEKKEEQLKYVSRVLSVVNDIHLLFEGIWSSFEREILMIRELGGDISRAESLLRMFQERYMQHNYLGALETAHSMDDAINYAKKEYFQNGAPMILSSIKRSMVSYRQINIDMGPVEETYKVAVEAIQNDRWQSAQAAIDEINRMFLRIEMQVDMIDDPSTIDVTKSLPTEISTFEEEGLGNMLSRLDDSVSALPLDFEHTVVVLARMKERIKLAREHGVDVERSLRYFAEAEPELRKDEYLKALILSKQANDALLEAEALSENEQGKAQIHDIR